MEHPIEQSHNAFRAIAVCLLAMVFGTALIVRSDLAYNQTMDEGTHIASGMEWLDNDLYNYDKMHPPLARAAEAALPYLAGDRTHGQPPREAEVDSILYAHGNKLLLARLGLLPFFWLAGWLIFAFLREHAGAWCAAAAVIVFAFCPVPLGHYAVCTTDAALLTMFLWSVLSFHRYLKQSDWRTALTAILSFGLAVLTKFTELPFFFVAAMVLIAHHVLTQQPFTARLAPQRVLSPVRRFLLVTLCALPLVWAAYRFPYDALFTPATTSVDAQEKLQHLSPHMRTLMTQVKFPAPEFLRGLIVAYETGGTMQAHHGYLLGQNYNGAHWSFFPVDLLAKTQIAVLLLCIFGIFACLRTAQTRRSSLTAVMLAGIAGPLVVAMAGNLNLGVRHVLPVYAFVTMLAATGATYLWNSSALTPMLRRSAVVALLSWIVISCVVASPQLLPYYNEVARPFDDRITVDSDLDWGQDLYALEDRLKDVPPDQVSLQYFGDAFLPRHISARWASPSPEGHQEWVAISETFFAWNRAGYSWLAPYPYTRVGRSIRLYHLTK